MASAQPGESDFLTKLTEIAQSNLSNEQFGVSELAREMGISRSNLHRKVKAVTGISVSQFIRELRLQEALQLLRHTSLTVSEAAFQCGFHSVSYFNSSFRNYYGYPPGQAGKIKKEDHDSDSTLIRDTEPVRRRRKFIVFLSTAISAIILTLIVYILFKPFPFRRQSPETYIPIQSSANEGPGETGMYSQNETLKAPGQEVFEDDFSVAHDYLADSIAGTIWDGYLLNSGVGEMQDSKLFNLNTTDIPGSLFIEASNTDWERDEDDGVFLYKIVDADKNFDMSVMIGPNSNLSSLDGAVEWNSGGLMVKHPEADSVDFLILFASDNLRKNAVHMIKNVSGGLGTESRYKEAYLIKDYPWLRITRDGSIFTTYYGPDGVKWEEICSVNRSDLRGTPLMVGIAQATYSDWTTHIEYDNFSLLTTIPR